MPPSEGLERRNSIAEVRSSTVQSASKELEFVGSYTWSLNGRSPVRSASVAVRLRLIWQVVKQEQRILRDEPLQS